MKNNNASITRLFSEAAERFSTQQIAEQVGRDARTIARWRRSSPPDDLNIRRSLQELLAGARRPESRDEGFSFIDLFAGIGGMRRAFEKVGGHCVFTSEWDKYCLHTYQANFTTDHPVAGDITKVRVEDIPPHDVLVAGFPCQPFSIAGVSKKNALGRPHGFEDLTQGTLFFDVARIIKHHQPKVFLLENVKNLQNHDGGRTFAVMMDVLREELEYEVHVQVIDAKGFVPQHRERIFIVGFRGPTRFSWEQFKTPPADAKTLGDILLPARDVDRKYVLSDLLWGYLQQYAQKHREKGNGFGFGLFGKGHVARTLSARYYKDGSEILIDRGGERNPRRLTPRECARLMGYDDDFKIPVSDTQAYKQFGNSVVVPVVEAVARLMAPHIAAQ